MIRIAIIGTGGMAAQHAKKFSAMRGVTITAACDIDPARVEKFAREHGIPHTYTDHKKLLREAPVDAVSVVTPDQYHCPITLDAIAAGKHVLCEKPLATNYTDAKKMADAARRKRIIHMVQFSYRSAAALQKARALIAAGKLGRIVHFHAAYYQSWLSTKIWGDWRTTNAWLWRQSTAHGSKGVLGDVGVHIIDFATYPIGAGVKHLACTLKTYTEIKGRTRRGYRLDANDTALIQCELDNGALGQIEATRWATGHANTLTLTIHGTAGALRIDLDKSYQTLDVCLGSDIHNARWKTLQLKPTPDNFARFIKSIRTGKNDQPDFARGAQIQNILDHCFLSNDKKSAVTLRQLPQTAPANFATKTPLRAC
jgi:predicted dehydrogenase